MSEANKELKNIIEAAILVADDPLSIKQMISLFPDNASPDKKSIQQAIDQLSEDCTERGIELKKVGSGYRFQSKEQYAPWLRKLYEQKPPRYSRAVLETLSIIAYKQPVTRGDIEEVRGVSVSTEIMRTLLARGWVKEVGFKAVPGRPALYATTKVFLEYFNLKSIRELPRLQEKRELDEIAKDNQIQLPIEETDVEPGEQLIETSDDSDHNNADGLDAVDNTVDDNTNETLKEATV